MPLKQKGFTLVELAVVVFLIGILASLGISALNAQMASASISTTKKKQDTIKDALIAYLGRNKRLPCPAIVTGAGVIDGTEAPRTGAVPPNCQGYFGILPYAELGLSKTAAIDGYENFFSYAVSPQWTATYTSAAPVAGGKFTNDSALAFNIGVLGAITVSDHQPPNAPTQTYGNLANNFAAVIVISHGKNGLGAFTSKGTQNVSIGAGTDELPNIPNAATWSPVLPATFYQREYNDNPTAATYFDDVILTLGTSDVKNALMRDGALKSPDSQWAEQIASINSAVIGFIVSTPCVPPNVNQFSALLNSMGIPTPIPGVFADPWGNKWTYTKGGNVSPGAPGATPYTVLPNAGLGLTIPPNLSFSPIPINAQLVAPPSTLNTCP